MICKKSKCQPFWMKKILAESYFLVLTSSKRDRVNRCRIEEEMSKQGELVTSPSVNLLCFQISLSKCPIVTNW